MIRLANTFHPLENEIYIQHCPMANNDKGADWISLEKEILNPFFGKTMLKCGFITDTIH